MDKAKFTDKKTGQLVKITAPDDWAFIPDPLPANWAWPNALWPLLAEAKQAVATLNGIGQTLPNSKLLLTPLQKREALRSSSLEGTYATPEELLIFEMNPRIPKSDKDPANDWLEVSNYGAALRLGCQMLEQLPLSLRLVREIHRQLLMGVRGRDKTPGEFRTRQVQIGSDARFIPPPAQHVMPTLDSFEKYMNQSNDYDPLVRAYVTHYQFEAIHPFLDGNGRVGRLLLALATYKWCGHAMPWLYMSAFFDKYKDEYIEKLFGVSTKGDWDSWIEFCLRGTIEQANDSISRCEQLRRVKADYQRKLSTGSVRLMSLIDDLFNSPFVEVAELARRRQITYPTAKSDIERLVQVGILRELPNLRVKTYYSPRIFGIAYSDELNRDSDANASEPPAAQSPDASPPAVSLP
jgi:Fic family protein